MSKPKPKKPRIRSLNDLSVNDTSNASEGQASGGRTTGDAARSRLTGGVVKAPNANHRKQPQPASLPSSSLSSSGGGHLKICHVPALANADSAKSLLDRVCREFEPIMKRRGYYAKIRSVSEMCCCFDGLDFDPFTKQRTKTRKRRVMPANVWGYNQTTCYGSNKWNTIHLRLRHPNAHDRLLCYEDVAGTMAHELAHCEIGPHNDAFQKLMDDILEEHMELQYKGAFTTLNGNNNNDSATSVAAHFPGQGTALGGGGTSFSNPRYPGYKLGGDAKFTKWLTPGEAACAAAEARRRALMVRGRGDHCCQPCTITIDDDETSDDDQENKKEEKKMDDLPGQNKRVAEEDERKQPAKQRAQAASKRASADNSNNNHSRKKPVPTRNNDTIIDLTCDDDDDDDEVVVPNPTVAHGWACRQCTFLNSSMKVSCDMCHAERTLRLVVKY